MRRGTLLASLAVLFAGQAAAQDIVAARYAAPTDRYGHRVLGAGGEWAALILDLADGTVRRFTLPDTLVFEDVAPRLADLDGDGTSEVIVVESSLREGARLAVYGPEGRIATTPHIGTRNRWLAPAAIADLNGDGITDIAYVETPHLGKVLRVWSWTPGGLTEIARLSGVTNHRIGDEVIWGGLRDCGQGSEIVLADAGFQSLVAVSFAGATLAARPLGIEASPAEFERAMACG